MTDVNGQTNFTQQFAINGQRGVEAVFAMDDCGCSDPEMGGSTFTNFNVDAIQELQSSSGWMRRTSGARQVSPTSDTVREKAVFTGILRVLRTLPSMRELFRSPVDCGPGRILRSAKRVSDLRTAGSRVAERV